jgi:hypothetical protein
LKCSHAGVPQDRVFLAKVAERTLVLPTPPKTLAQKAVIIRFTQPRDDFLHRWIGLIHRALHQATETIHGFCIPDAIASRRSSWSQKQPGILSGRIDQQGLLKYRPARPAVEPYQNAGYSSDFSGRAGPLGPPLCFFDSARGRTEARKNHGYISIRFVCYAQFTRFQ